MGLLLATVRVQLVALSVLPTHKSCHVEWADTEATAVRMMMLVFILSVDRRYVMVGEV